MEPAAFDVIFEEICVLDKQDGPSRNVFEPKFQAREKARELQQSIEQILSTAPSLVGQAQLSRCYVFIGCNMIETDEDKDGMIMLLTAHRVIIATLAHELLSSFEKKFDPLESVLLADIHALATEDSMKFAFEYLEVLNAVCVYLANNLDTKYRMDDARKLLHRAEQAFYSWNEWFATLPPNKHCDMNDLDIDDSGKLITDKLDADAVLVRRTRQRMEACHTTTVFLLSQVYGQKGDIAMASKYCHRTLARQLQTKQEYSRKEWAKNAMMLSSYFVSIQDFGKALYCNKAGEYMMPDDKKDEETYGVVCWGMGRYYLCRLQFYSSVALGEESICDNTASRADEWWEEFKLPIENAQILPHITTFEAARDEFKEGNRWLQEALKVYVMDGCCSDHIRILQDMSNLYKYLIVFEANVERRIAMHMRRVAPLESLPSELNFQAYATLIRQLLFDLGDVYSEVVDLRILQKKVPDEKYGKPLSDSKLNELCTKAKSFFERFCETFKDIKSGTVPEVLEQESRVAFFRALMRLANLQSKMWYKSPKAEYEGIGLTIQRYSDALKFAHANNMNGEVDQEIALAREMTILLPNKQKDIYSACARSGLA